MKTSDLQDTALDWAVAEAEKTDVRLVRTKKGSPLHVCKVDATGSTCGVYSPSTRWDTGGPIVERERISLQGQKKMWWASYQPSISEFGGPAPLIAAMRCYVASKLGEEVEVPKELVRS